MKFSCDEQLSYGQNTDIGNRRKKETKKQEKKENERELLQLQTDLSFLRFLFFLSLI